MIGKCRSLNKTSGKNFQNSSFFNAILLFLRFSYGKNYFLSLGYNLKYWHFVLENTLHKIYKFNLMKQNDLYFFPKPTFFKNMVYSKVLNCALAV